MRWSAGLDIRRGTSAMTIASGGPVVPDATDDRPGGEASSHDDMGVDLGAWLAAAMAGPRPSDHSRSGHPSHFHKRAGRASPMGLCSLWGLLCRVALITPFCCLTPQRCGMSPSSRL